MARTTRGKGSAGKAKAGARAKAKRGRTRLVNPPPDFVKKVAGKRGQPLDNKWRTVVNVKTAKLVPYGLQGKKQTDLTWYNVSYDPRKGQGVFLIRFKPGGLSVAHEHLGFEEFLILEGTVIDSDGAVYRAGDFVSLKPGSKHLSYSPRGTYALVILRGGKPSRTLRAGERINIR